MATDTRNFKVSEFACHCCGENKIEQRVIDTCQMIRDEMGIPIHINSGYRCKQHNANVGGVKNSYHTQGLAADLSCGRKAIELFLKIHELYVNGKLPELKYVILYLKKNFVHIDCGNARSFVFEIRA